MQARKSDTSEFTNIPQGNRPKIRLKFLSMEKEVTLSDLFQFLNFPQKNLNKIKFKLLRMEKGPRFSDKFVVQTFLNEFRFELKLKLSERLLFGNSADYPQLVNEKCRRENPTPLNFQIFLNEIRKKSN